MRGLKSSAGRARPPHCPAERVTCNSPEGGRRHTSCHCHHRWHLVNFPPSLCPCFLCPQLATPPQLEECFLFREMDWRLRPRKDQLSLAWPPHSVSPAAPPCTPTCSWALTYPSVRPAPAPAPAPPGLWIEGFPSFRTGCNGHCLQGARLSPAPPPAALQHPGTPEGGESSSQTWVQVRPPKLQFSDLQTRTQIVPPKRWGFLSSGALSTGPGPGSWTP